jgi:hypothetical protein
VDWVEAIHNGQVTVDCEVVVGGEMKVEEDYFVEYVNCRQTVGTQTNSGGTFKEEGKGDEESKTSGSGLALFLRRVVPIIEKELELNLTSRAFDAVALGASDSDYQRDASSSEYELWNTLSVDLEKYKVVYPDWSKGRHQQGVITRCSVTRTSERVYDIEFDDGVKLYAVKEAYIRVPMASSNDKIKKGGISRYAMDMRVHVRVVKSNRSSMYVPGRIRSVSASNNTYEVEVEGGVVEKGVPVDDILLGLDEGLTVEARRPHLPQLQTTSLSWSSTGGALAVSYGIAATSGFCDVPGAVCIW